MNRPRQTQGRGVARLASVAIIWIKSAIDLFRSLGPTYDVYHSHVYNRNWQLPTHFPHLRLIFAVRRLKNEYGSRHWSTARMCLSSMLKEGLA